MSVHDHDSLLMDYLYDELSPSEREAFERRIASDDTLRKQVAELQDTRVMLKKNAMEVQAPSKLMQDLARQARLAAAPPVRESFWDKLNHWVMSPSMATVALVVVVAVTGVYITRENQSLIERDVSAPEDARKTLAPEASAPPSRETVAAVVPEDESPAAGETAEPAERTVAGVLSKSLDEEGKFASPALPLPSPVTGDKVDDRFVGGSGSVARAEKSAPLDGLGGGLASASRPARYKKASKALANNTYAFGEEEPAPQPVLQPTTAARGPDDDHAAKDKLGRKAPVTIAQAEVRRDAEGQARAPVREINVMKTETVPAVATDTPQFDELEVADVDAKEVQRRVKVRRVVKAQTDSSKAATTAPSSSGQELVYRSAKVKRGKTGAGFKADQRVSARKGAIPSLEKNQSEAPQQKFTEKQKEGVAKAAYDRGEQHLQNQRFSKAIRDFKEAANKTRNSMRAADAKRGIARAHLRQKQLGQAVKQYRKLLKNHPKYRYRDAVLVETARVELEIGDLNAARNHLATAARSKNNRHAAEADKLLQTVDARLKARALKAKAVGGEKTKSKKTKAAKPRARDEAVEQAPPAEPAAPAPTKKK